MPGIGISLFLLAVGAIMDFAVTANPNQHGLNINAVGVILMIVGAVGLVISIVFLSMGGSTWYGPHRRRTIVDDGQGNVVRREDQYQ